MSWNKGSSLKALSFEVLVLLGFLLLSLLAFDSFSLVFNLTLLVQLFILLLIDVIVDVRVAYVAFLYSVPRVESVQVVKGFQHFLFCAALRKSTWPLRVCFTKKISSCCFWETAFVSCYVAVFEEILGGLVILISALRKLYSWLANLLDFVLADIWKFLDRSGDIVRDWKHFFGRRLFWYHIVACRVKLTFRKLKLFSEFLGSLQSFLVVHHIKAF